MFTKTSAAHQVAHIVFDDTIDIAHHVRTAAYQSNDSGPGYLARHTLDDGTRFGIDDRDFNGLAHIDVAMSKPGAPTWYPAVLPAYDDATRADAARVLVELVRAVLDTVTDDVEFDDEHGDGDE